MWQHCSRTRARPKGAAMPRVTSQPDDLNFEVSEGETLLEAGLRSGVAFAHACGGRAKCSTCRIWVTEGLNGCHERNELES
ncbi:MAG: 2Fe-2S iron-sulfur cluster binding domain-containing protein, partial [Gammaproteobacteria bacterium]|nr:(2Fe-2S)-binding protein [Gammaproteobacteria bacterium]NIV46908.1 2Fe-2S iron-sulfur cluster binding domain-containing protein [Gammaproteobacteria bacterium]NIW54994.1 2Fe-2S iron-sulfur cluster binding domain-containing protein [Gammaproteobacteria bacterium]NIX04081.1 2Fe-2S iron-sulfur cluster binding domain-containing protein [Gammaproteobacteria bacterium]